MNARGVSLLFHFIVPTCVRFVEFVSNIVSITQKILIKYNRGQLAHTNNDYIMYLTSIYGPQMALDK